MQGIFDRKAKEIDFKVGYLVLRWDTRREDKGKHGMFDSLSYDLLALLAFVPKNGSKTLLKTSRVD